MNFLLAISLPVAILAVGVGDIQAGLLSVLIIIGLAMTLRQQVASTQSKRLEETERDLQTAKQKIAQLEALPTLTTLETKLDEHDRHSKEAWLKTAEAIREQTALLEKRLPMNGEH